MGKCTIPRMAQMYRERLGIGIPHPEPETCHMAEALGVLVPCCACPFDYACEQCDAKITEMYNEAVKAEAN